MKTHFSGLGSSLSGYKLFPMASHPQTLRNYNLGFFPNHNSYGVVSTDFDGALFKVNAAVSNAYPQNDSGKSVRDIIDRTISNRVRLRRSDTPFRCGVPGGVSCEKIPHFLR